MPQDSTRIQQPLVHFRSTRSSSVPDRGRIGELSPLGGCGAAAWLPDTSVESLWTNMVLLLAISDSSSLFELPTVCMVLMCWSRPGSTSLNSPDDFRDFDRSTRSVQQLWTGRLRKRARWNRLPTDLSVGTRSHSWGKKSAGGSSGSTRFMYRGHRQARKIPQAAEPQQPIPAQRLKSAANQMGS